MTKDDAESLLFGDVVCPEKRWSIYDRVSARRISMKTGGRMVEIVSGLQRMTIALSTS